MLHFKFKDYNLLIATVQKQTCKGHSETIIYLEKQ